MEGVTQKKRLLVLLNYWFSQKLKLLEYYKFDHLTNTSNTPPPSLSHMQTETTF